MIGIFNDKKLFLLLSFDLFFFNEKYTGFSIQAGNTATLSHPLHKSVHFETSSKFVRELVIAIILEIHHFSFFGNLPYRICEFLKTDSRFIISDPRNHFIHTLCDDFRRI